MAKLPILVYPDSRLHTVAKPVTAFDERLHRVIDDMFETMYDARGVGLAATQVDHHEQLVVIDVSEERNQPLVVINPEVVWMSEERLKGEEGCLSVPGVYDGVERAAQVHVKALDRHGQSRVIEAEGLLAVCLLSAIRGYTQGQGQMLPTAVSQVVESAGKLVVGLGLTWYLLTVRGVSPEIGAAGAMAGDAVAGEQGRVLWARGGLRRAECWQQQTGGQKCTVFDSCMRLLDKRLSHILFEIWRIQARAHGCGSLRWMMGMLCLRSGARRTNSTIFSCCGDLLHTGSVAAASPVTMKAWQRQPPKSL